MRRSVKTAFHEEVCRRRDAEEVKSFNNATSSYRYMEHRAPAKGTLSNVDFR